MGGLTDVLRVTPVEEGLLRLGPTSQITSSLLSFYWPQSSQGHLDPRLGEVDSIALWEELDILSVVQIARNLSQTVGHNDIMCSMV